MASKTMRKTRPMPPDHGEIAIAGQAIFATKLDRTTSLPRATYKKS
jgi:hypothetical protein